MAKFDNCAILQVSNDISMRSFRPVKVNNQEMNVITYCTRTFPSTSNNPCQLSVQIHVKFIYFPHTNNTQHFVFFAIWHHLILQMKTWAISLHRKQNSNRKVGYKKWRFGLGVVWDDFLHIDTNYIVAHIIRTHSIKISIDEIWNYFCRWMTRTFT